MKDDALTLAAAWKNYDTLLSDDHVFIAQESAGLEQRWHRRTQGCNYSHRVWTDAYLVAFAEAAGFTNVSFDQGFQAYDDIKSLVLRHSSGR